MQRASEILCRLHQYQYNTMVVPIFYTYSYMHMISVYVIQLMSRAWQVRNYEVHSKPD